MIGVSTFAATAPYKDHFLKQIDNWPGKIILYLEAPIDFEHEKLEKRNFFQIPGVTQFLTNIKQVPQAMGIMENGVYNYNFDLWKFCRKMFCQFDAFKEGGKVFWLDADLELKKPIPEEFLEALFQGSPLTYLGREGFYTETGFVGFDTTHDDFTDFEERYINILKTGGVFKLKGWHDCYCFDYAKQDLGRNLTPHWKKGDDLNVIKNSPLKDYFFHHKGNRKQQIS